MSGFPVRPTRSALGPEPRDRRPVTDPELELGAQIGRLMFWQLAGLGMCAPRAMALVEDDGTLLASGESWNSRLELPAPIAAQTGTGVYTLTYPATVPDEEGVQIPLELLGATATVQEATALHTSCVVEPSGYVVTVRVWNAAGAAANGKTLVSVF